MAARVALSSKCHQNEYIHGENLKTKSRRFNDNSYSLSEPRYPRLEDFQDKIINKYFVLHNPVNPFIGVIGVQTFNFFKPNMEVTL